MGVRKDVLLSINSREDASLFSEILRDLEGRYTYPSVRNALAFHQKSGVLRSFQDTTNPRFYRYGFADTDQAQVMYRTLEGLCLKK